jgi:hypothetical protein
MSSSDRTGEEIRKARKPLWAVRRTGRATRGATLWLRSGSRLAGGLMREVIASQRSVWKSF